MLEPLKHILSSQRIVLASGSPRRAEILQAIGLKAEIIPSEFDESVVDKSNFNSPADYVIETAYQKAKEVSERLQSDSVPPDLIIGADTNVALGKVCYGKPKDAEDAFKHLSLLSGQVHTVYTGVALLHRRGTSYHAVKFHEATDVHMATMSPEVIQAYIDTKEPMDKAGSYGIQGLGATLIQSIRGDYFTVMGLPAHHLSQQISSLYEPKSVLGCP